MYEIKNRFTNLVVYRSEGATTAAEAVAEAVAEAASVGADLSGANLSGANLYGADLSGANLSGANLSRANLSRANLYWANLYGANLSGATLPHGETWEDYIAEVVPSLLTAGGKPLAEVLDTGCWECHRWDNCPMHAAFGISDCTQGPALLRPRIAEFVQFFDAGLIPKPTIAAQ